MLLNEFFSRPEGENTINHDTAKHTPDVDKNTLLEDVLWFIIEDDRIHKQVYLPLAQKIRASNGKVTPDHVVGMAKAGCIAYFKEKNMTGDIADVFDKDFREELCRMLCDKLARDVNENSYQLGESTDDKIDSDTKDTKIKDPEVLAVRAFARSHYPSSNSDEEAFDKFVVHSLRHAEEDDGNQDTAIDKLHVRLAELEAKLKDIRASGEIRKPTSTISVPESMQVKMNHLISILQEKSIK